MSNFKITWLALELNKIEFNYIGPFFPFESHFGNDPFMTRPGSVSIILCRNIHAIKYVYCFYDIYHIVIKCLKIHIHSF